MRKRNFTSLEVLAEQVRKAELQIFASKGRVEAREQNFTYLAVKAERKCGCGSGTSHFGSQCRTKVRTWNFISLPVKAERKCVEAEHPVFGSQGRAEVWKRNFRSLAVKTERKCSQAL